MLGVTSGLTLTYMAPSPVGTWIEIVAQLEQIGKTVAVITCDVYGADGADGPRLDKKRVTASHTKIDNSHLFGPTSRKTEAGTAKL